MLAALLTAAGAAGPAPTWAAEFGPMPAIEVDAKKYVAANDKIPRALETYRDSIALQFPVKPPQGTAKRPAPSLRTSSR